MTGLPHVRRRSVLVLAATVLVVAAAGAAYAAAGSDGTITVCIHHVGGGLYKATQCAKGDHTLSWNSRGPQGPAGPSHVYYNDVTTVSIPADSNFPFGTPTPVLSVRVPEGSFWLTGKMFAFATPTSPFGLNCNLVKGTTTIDSTHGEIPAGAGNMPFAFAGALKLSAPATITLECDAQQAVTAYSVQLAAIKTGSLTLSPPSG